jgi:hypothetical protein
MGLIMSCKSILGRDRGAKSGDFAQQSASFMNVFILEKTLHSWAQKKLYRD